MPKKRDINFLTFFSFEKKLDDCSKMFYYQLFFSMHRNLKMGVCQNPLILKNAKILFLKKLKKKLPKKEIFLKKQNIKKLIFFSFEKKLDDCSKMFYYQLFFSMHRN